MSLEEYGRLLNLLLECERAGAKLLPNILLCEEPALNRQYHGPARNRAS